VRIMINVFSNALKIKKVGLYGKSLGGYLAVQNAQKVNFLILDRTFYNMSLFIRLDASQTV
jgi:hypothetical protein